jgi:hypothetical protein
MIVLETNSASGRHRILVGGASHYFFFFAMQDPGEHVARPENLVWSLHLAFGYCGAQLPGP